MTTVPVVAITVTGTPSGGNVNFTKPTVSVGDLLVVALAGDGNDTITPPAGWVSQVHAAIGGNQEPGLDVFTHVVTGSEGSSFAFASSDGSNILGQLIQVTGVDPVTPIDRNSNAYGFNQTGISPPSVTTRVDNTLILTIGSAWQYGNTTYTITGGPSGSTSVANVTNSSNRLGIFSKGQATQGATSGGITLSQAVDAIVGLIAIRPAGADAAPTIDVGPDTNLTYGDTFTATATAVNPDGTISGYAWTVPTKPSGSAATFATPSAASSTFHPDKPGAYTLRCTVTESDGALTAYDEMILTVRAQLWTRVGGVWKPAKRRVRKNGVWS